MINNLGILPTHIRIHTQTRTDNDCCINSILIDISCKERVYFAENARHSRSLTYGARNNPHVCRRMLRYVEGRAGYRPESGISSGKWGVKSFRERFLDLRVFIPGSPGFLPGKGGFTTYLNEYQLASSFWLIGCVKKD